MEARRHVVGLYRRRKFPTVITEKTAGELSLILVIKDVLQEGSGIHA
jgi:hypothetical protein